MTDHPAVDTDPADYPIQFTNTAAYDTAYQPMFVTIHDGMISVMGDRTGVDLWMLH